jgi:hypothetical protein
MIERCRRLAGQTSDPLTQTRLLELAADARPYESGVGEVTTGSVIRPLPSHLSHRAELQIISPEGESTIKSSTCYKLCALNGWGNMLWTG